MHNFVNILKPLSFTLLKVRFMVYEVFLKEAIHESRRPPRHGQFWKAPQVILMSSKALHPLLD